MKFYSVFTPCFCDDGKNSLRNQDNVKETGYDRVRKMFNGDEYGLMSPEMFYLMQNASVSVSVAAVIGAAVNASKVRKDYLRQNVASTYESEFLAKRHLTDKISLGAFRGGFQYAVKYGSFSTLYMLSTMTIANYNDKISIWEHIGSSALLGSLSRINFGLKGMAVGAGVGGLLGSFFGGILVLSMKYFNLTLEDLRTMQSEQYYDSKRTQNERSTLEKI